MGGGPSETGFGSHPDAPLPLRRSPPPPVCAEAARGPTPPAHKKNNTTPPAVGLHMKTHSRPCVVATRLSLEEFEALRQAAHAEGRSLSEFVREAVRARSRGEANGAA
jgi:hypothetical protein